MTLYSNFSKSITSTFTEYFFRLFLAYQRYSYFLVNPNLIIAIQSLTNAQSKKTEDMFLIPLKGKINKVADKIISSLRYGIYVFFAGKALRSRLTYRVIRTSRHHYINSIAGELKILPFQ